jgi:PAS domain S-box-containing protein
MLTDACVTLDGALPAEPCGKLDGTLPADGCSTSDCALLAALVEASSDAIIGISLEGRIISWNRAAASMFGYPAAEAIGRQVDMLMPPEREREKTRPPALLQSAEHVAAFDTVRLTKDGTRLDVSVTIAPILDAAGRVIGAAKTARDMTAARRTAAALEESEARLRFILDSAQIGDWELDLATGATRRSLQHDRCFGYADLQPEWNFEIFLQHVQPDDRAMVRQCFERAVRERHDWRMECRIVWPDGSQRWLRVCGSVKCDGAVAATLLGIVMDITQQKQADELHRASSAYARSLIEASLDPLVTISAQGKITDVNAASVEATGVQRQDLIGRDFSDYFTAPDQARAGYRRAFSEGFVRDYPLAIRHASGRTMDVLYNAAVYRDDAGAVRGVFAAARDVTQRKRLDQVLMDSTAELQSAKRVAERANLAKSDFLSSMSHELRSPLNAILGFAQLMDSGSPPPTVSQKESIGQILRAGWYLLELINEVLDLALIESGRTSLLTEPVCLAAVMADCQAMIEPQAVKCGIAVAFAPIDAAWHVCADRMRVKQIFINLLSNAIKYNRVGGTVEVSCAGGASGRVRIGFRDCGMGLAAEELAQLFQPFNRLGREGSAQEGTGIGLVVSKRLVELMGGRIGAESIVGVGSLFWVELDTVATPAQPHDVLIAAPDAHAAAQQHAGCRTLLCVEDNAANLRLVEKILERRPDIRMVSARDGIRGVELARSVGPAAILMDINLPGPDGFAALRILSQDPLTAHIPVIALSANAMPHDIGKGIAAGFFRYLTKPIKVDEFMQTLDEALLTSGGEPALAAQEQCA